MESDFFSSLIFQHYFVKLFKWHLYWSWMLTIYNVLISHYLNLVMLIREHKH